MSLSLSLSNCFYVSLSVSVLILFCLSLSVSLGVFFSHSISLSLYQSPCLCMYFCLYVCLSVSLPNHVTQEGSIFKGQLGLKAQPKKQQQQQQPLSLKSHLNP